jgi:hypothetical protein
MRGMAPSRRAFGYALSVAAALLAACGEPQPPDAMPQSPALLAHAAHHGSWMTPNEQGALLYVSDAVTHEVRVYSWPTLSHVGTLTGLKTPFGECVDASANVWIVNTNASDLVRYAHGGMFAFKTLKDPGYFPNDCSVNPRNGDVAVANESGKGGGPGNIRIYKGGVDSPTTYKDPVFQSVTFLAYDTDGNLFLDGKNSDGAFRMAKFKDGTFTPITISGATIEAPGGVFTEGLALSAGDLRDRRGHAVVYQITDTGTVTSTTNTMSEVCAQYFIAGSAKEQKLICPNFRGPSVDIYDYPAGGARVEHIKAGLEFPFGSVISP